MATQILSPLNPSAFNLVIDTLKYPNAQFSIQTAALPDLTAVGAAFNTPKRNITQMPDKINYGSFTCAFLVDENMLNYEEIHDWMLDLVETNDQGASKVRDMVLQVRNSNNNVVKEIQFIDAYPVNLSSIPFDLTAGDVNYLVATVEFYYSYFNMITTG